MRNRLAVGAAILCTYPLEHMAARTPRVNPEDTWRLYAALAETAGVVRPVSVVDPRIVAGAVRQGGSPPSILVNCSGEPLVAEPVLGGSEAIAPRVIGPMGVAVIPSSEPVADLETVPASHEGGDPLGAP